ncbi:hypothetical protein AWC38_SpisGene14141 [Stylophora pistillata]|uniref:Uncharacterized protein n=1 Tax=Stylophora pistillata TaxID=50429 RepID=A0A2B4RX56_STYPI|nr:hypothetical protein AWC38_SpisGene14141 [Stylophora pistillata]
MQLTSIKKLNKENVIFNEAVVNQYGSKSSNIEVKNGWGENTPGPLVIESPLLFSFGVQKSLDKAGNLTGYSIPTYLWGVLDQPSRKEFDFYDGLKKIEDLCYEHLENLYGPEIPEMLKLPLIEREGKAPILYSKLIFSKKTQNIHTLFRSRENAKENPLDYHDQYCKVKMELIIDSIYISDEAVTVQIKVNDIFVKPLPQRQPLVSLSSDEEDEEEGPQFSQDLLIGCKGEFTHIDLSVELFYICESLEKEAGACYCSKRDWVHGYPSNYPSDNDEHGASQVTEKTLSFEALEDLPRAPPLLVIVFVKGFELIDLLLSDRVVDVIEVENGCVSHFIMNIP